jgi:hypothetical protein
MTDHSKEEKTVSIAIIAIVAALSLLVVVVIAALTIPLQQAEAKGVCSTPGLFRSAINSGNQSLISCIPR